MAQQQNEISISPAGYIEGKKDGSCKIVKINGATFMTQRVFHQVTGKPMPILIPVELERFEAMFADTKKALAGLEEMIADIKAAKEVVTG